MFQKNIGRCLRWFCCTFVQNFSTFLTWTESDNPNDRFVKNKMIKYHEIYEWERGEVCWTKFWMKMILSSNCSWRLYLYSKNLVNQSYLMKSFEKRVLCSIFDFQLRLEHNIMIIRIAICTGTRLSWHFWPMELLLKSLKKVKLWVYQMMGAGGGGGGCRGGSDSWYVRQWTYSFLLICCCTQQGWICLKQPLSKYVENKDDFSYPPLLFPLRDRGVKRL